MLPLLAMVVLKSKSTEVAFWMMTSVSITHFLAYSELGPVNQKISVNLDNVIFLNRNELKYVSSG